MRQVGLILVIVGFLGCGSQQLCAQQYVAAARGILGLRMTAAPAPAVTVQSPYDILGLFNRVSIKSSPIVQAVLQQVKCHPILFCVPSAVAVVTLATLLRILLCRKSSEMCSGLTRFIVSCLSAPTPEKFVITPNNPARLDIFLRVDCLKQEIRAFAAKDTDKTHAVMNSVEAYVVDRWQWKHCTFSNSGLGIQVKHKKESKTFSVKKINKMLGNKFTFTGDDNSGYIKFGEGYRYYWVSTETGMILNGDGDAPNCLRAEL